MQSAKSAKKNRFTTRHSNETISAHDRRDYDSELGSRKLARMIVLSDPKKTRHYPALLLVLPSIKNKKWVVLLILILNIYENVYNHKIIF